MGLWRWVFFRGRWKWRWDRELSNELGKEAKSICREVQQRREDWRKKKEKRKRERETISGKGKEKRRNKKWPDKIF